MSECHVSFEPPSEEESTNDKATGASKHRRSERDEQEVHLTPSLPQTNVTEVKEQRNPRLNWAREEKLLGEMGWAKENGLSVGLKLMLKWANKLKMKGHMSIGLGLRLNPTKELEWKGPIPHGLGNFNGPSSQQIEFDDFAGSGDQLTRDLGTYMTRYAFVYPTQNPTRFQHIKEPYLLSSSSSPTSMAELLPSTDASNTLRAPGLTRALRFRFRTSTPTTERRRSFRRPPEPHHRRQSQDSVFAADPKAEKYRWKMRKMAPWVCFSMESSIPTGHDSITASVTEHQQASGPEHALKLEFLAFHVVLVFCEVYRQVYPSLYPTMHYLFGTWSIVFPFSVLRKIEAQLQFSPQVNHQPSGLTPLRGFESPRPTHGIHVNLKYLEARHRLGHANINNNLQHARGASSTLKLYGQTPAIANDEYNSDNREVIFSQVGGQGLSSTAHTGHTSFAIEAEKLLPSAATKIARSSSPFGIRHARPPSPSIAEFAVNDSPGRVIGRASPSHPTFDYGLQNMIEPSSKGSHQTYHLDDKVVPKGAVTIQTHTQTNTQGIFWTCGRGS